MTKNLATEYLRQNGQTIDDWDGICGELANEVMGPNDHILHVEPACLWQYHMVPLIDGLVHDAWCEGPAIPVKEWLIRLCGCDVVTVALNGMDIYHGPANAISEDVLNPWNFAPDASVGRFDTPNLVGLPPEVSKRL